MSSFLLRSSRLNARGFALPRSTTTTTSARGFANSRAFALKEGDRNAESAEYNEHHKQDQLQKQKEGKGHWKPELASNSEEAIAADREGGTQSIEELQKKTADHAEKKHK